MSDKKPPDDIQRSGMRWAPRIFFIVLAVALMGSLSAIVDAVLHPEIEYLDDEHLIVGSVTALITALFFSALALYVRRQENLAVKHRSAVSEAVENEKKYREIFEESRDAIFVSTPEGSIEEINPAGVDLFGYGSREEMLDLRTSELYASEADMQAGHRLFEERGTVKNQQIKMRRKDGSEMSVSVTARVERDKAGKAVAYHGSIRDVTAQKQMEHQVLQSQKMDSIGRLAASVAHDFNNYLTTIQGCTELAMMGLAEDSQLSASLGEVRKASDAAADLTSQLLMFSRHQTMEMRTVNLNRIVEGASPTIQRLVGDQVRVISNLADNLDATMADAGNVTQAIANLALNASDSMPNGGDLTITTCNGEVKGAYMETHPEARAGDFVTVSVSDSGPGITGMEMAHIFEPFHEGSEGGGNAGLGLSVVYGIIMQHDGWIDVDSITGLGTTFTVFLPAVKNLDRVEDIDAPAIADIGRTGERILLVEDDDAVRAITEKMLREGGYEVVGAHDAAEAFARFAGEKGDFQLVFSDVALPGDDGVTLAENLKTHKPELAVLLASGYADSVVDWNKMQSRGYRFLQKPYVMPELLKVVRELLANTS